MIFVQFSYQAAYMEVYCQCRLGCLTRYWSFFDILVFCHYLVAKNLVALQKYLLYIHRKKYSIQNAFWQNFEVAQICPVIVPAYTVFSEDPFDAMLAELIFLVQNLHTLHKYVLHIHRKKLFHSECLLTRFHVCANITRYRIRHPLPHYLKAHCLTRYWLNKSCSSKSSCATYICFIYA